MTSRFKPGDFAGTSPASGAEKPKPSGDKALMMRVASKCVAVAEETVEWDGQLFGHLIGAKFDPQGNCGFQVAVIPKGESIREHQKYLVHGVRSMLLGGCDYVGIVALAVGVKLKTDAETQEELEAELRQKANEVADEIGHGQIDEVVRVGHDILLTVSVLSAYDHAMWSASMRHEKKDGDRVCLAINGAWAFQGKSPDIEKLLQQVRLDAVDRSAKSKPSLN